MSNEAFFSTRILINEESAKQFCSNTKCLASHKNSFLVLVSYIYKMKLISNDHAQHHVVNHKLPVHDFPLVYERHPAKQHQHVAFDFLLAQRVLCILDDL